MEIRNIKTSLLKSNTGQIEGLPKNPRFIKDEKYALLLNSIKEDPEMLELREVIVYPFEDKFVIIGGNMRLRCLQELNYKEVVQTTSIKRNGEVLSEEEIQMYFKNTQAS